MMLLDALKAKDQKLTAENTGVGLKRLLTVAKAQRTVLPDVSFDLVSMSSIQAAREEALALIETLDGDGADLFAEE